MEKTVEMVKFKLLLLDRDEKIEAQKGWETYI